MFTLRPHQQRTVDALRSNERGTVYIPTGGGKTLCMINDVINHLDTATGISQTIVVVAPRIMLAIQLCEEFMEQVKNANVLHVHSGETKHFKTTKSDRINLFNRMCHHVGEHVIIFSTYNLSTVLLTLVSRSTLCTVTKRTTVYNATSSLLLLLLLLMLTAHSSSLPHLSLPRMVSVA